MNYTIEQLKIMCKNYNIDYKEIEEDAVKFGNMKTNNLSKNEWLENMILEEIFIIVRLSEAKDFIFSHKEELEEKIND